MLCMLFAEGISYAQKTPPAPDHPWDDSSAKQQLKTPARVIPARFLDPANIYTLSELVNIAEQNNPETRVAWENAKARAADLGIAQSTLYPTLAAAALAGSTRADIFFGPTFERQTVETFSPVFRLDYIIFDFGQRSQEISVSRSNLLAANFRFNDTHRKIIFQMMEAYYRLLDSKGRQDAADANLKNAQTVQQAAEARLQNGLATLPDVLQCARIAAGGNRRCCPGNVPRDGVFASADFQYSRVVLSGLDSVRSYWHSSGHRDANSVCTREF